MEKAAAIPAQQRRFECTGCGNCCKARGAYSFVYVSLEERRKLAQHLKMGTQRFTAEFCEQTGGFWHLRDPSNNCLFLKGAQCTVYEARPMQCRTWPFWPENFKDGNWLPHVKQDCEGIGRGSPVPVAEIEASFAEEKRRESLE